MNQNEERHLINFTSLLKKQSLWSCGAALGHARLQLALPGCCPQPGVCSGALPRRAEGWAVQDVKGTALELPGFVGWLLRHWLHIWTCMAARGLVGWASGRSVEGQNLGSGRLRSNPDIQLSPCPQPKPRELQVGFEEELKFFPGMTDLRDPNFCSCPCEKAPTVLSSSTNRLLSCHSLYSFPGFLGPYNDNAI